MHHQHCGHGRAAVLCRPFRYGGSAGPRKPHFRLGRAAAVRVYGLSASAYAVDNPSHDRREHNDRQKQTPDHWEQRPRPPRPVPRVELDHTRPCRCRQRLAVPGRVSPTHGAAIYELSDCAGRGPTEATSAWDETRQCRLKAEAVVVYRLLSAARRRRREISAASSLRPWSRASTWESVAHHAWRLNSVPWWSLAVASYRPFLISSTV
jgi:hypothetical protein